MGSLDELRARIGRHLPDEEFLLRTVMPADQVDAMIAAGPAPRTYDPGASGVKHLLSELTRRKGLASVKISRPGFSLELSGGT
jgi:oxaloacetate decarboxylase alpha subunit